MPRSPSRDLADRFATNRGYFRQPDGVRRAKNWLALAALGLTGGWAVVDAGSIDPVVVESSHTHGPLASVHAAWDSKCDACHAPQSAESFSPVSLFAAGGRWNALTCEKCHRGPTHHAAVPRGADGKSFNDRCENCHHDHGGRANSLVRLADGSCTNCHANLPASHADGKYAAYPEAEHITGFATAAGGHPEFRSLAKSDRGLKFSHALHMTPGQASPGGGPVWRLNDLSGPDRERYKAKDQGDDLVRLNCESCHRLDSGFPGAGKQDRDAFARRLAPLADQPKASVLPPRAGGAYYLPVNFDAHCKACHPVAAPPAKSGDLVIRPFDLPHRRQPAELKTLLRGEYAARLTFPDNPKASAPAGPGGRLDPRAPGGPAAFRYEADRLADAALGTLLLGAAKAGQDQSPGARGGYACGKCHLTDDPAARPEAQRIAAVPNRTVWLEHAKFDHTAHRSAACRECHPGTEAGYAPGQTAVVEREPVQILGVESCRACHSPARTETAADGTRQARGGVRHGCTDCHSYHDGDHPLRGRGAESRAPEKPLTVAEFFRGAP